MIILKVLTIFVTIIISIIGIFIILALIKAFIEELKK